MDREKGKRNGVNFKFLTAWLIEVYVIADTARRLFSKKFLYTYIALSRKMSNDFAV